MLPGALGASATHDSQTPHGLAVGPCAQFKDRARMRADEVFPQPRGPENKYAWLIRPASREMESGSVTCSCPTTSAKVAGRYLRYSATVSRLPAPCDDDAGAAGPAEKSHRRRGDSSSTGIECASVAFGVKLRLAPSACRRPQLTLDAAETSISSVAASSAQVANPSTASRRSDDDGKVGAMRMFLSSGSFRYGNDAPASVTAMPASLASATVRRAVPGNTSRLMK